MGPLAARVLSFWRRPKKPLPQLIMWYTRLAPPPRPKLPRGYGLRPFQVGDEAGWVDLLQANGQLGHWDNKRVCQQIDNQLNKQFFVCCAEELVAAAGVYRRQWKAGLGWEIGWVATHPDHGGQRLGQAVSAAALEWALDLPAGPIGLLTDDFRLPAIKIYLDLGFSPDLTHPSFGRRWQGLADQLGQHYAALCRGDRASREEQR